MKNIKDREKKLKEEGEKMRDVRVPKEGRGDKRERESRGKEQGEEKGAREQVRIERRNCNITEEQEEERASRSTFFSS